MSQAGQINIVNSTPSIPTSFVTNSGTAVPIANVLDILGAHVAASGSPVATTGATNVVTINVQAASAQGSSSATNMGLASFNSANFTVDANGYVSFSGTGTAETLTGNSGGAVSPTAGNINTVGTGSITIVGNPGTSTLTTQLTGLTNHAIQIGAGTATLTQLGAGTTGQVLQTNTGADPTWSTATYPSTTTINQILYSSSANVVGGITATNSGVLITSAAGVPSIAALTDGQVIIGSSAGAPLAATLTAGTGISVTNGHNSITIASTGSDMAWTDEAVSFNAAAGNGYFVTATATATLPASPSQGNKISFIVDGTQTLTIQANTGQVIRAGSGVSASAGTAANNARGDSMTLIYRSSDTTWIALSMIGTWTIT